MGKRIRKRLGVRYCECCGRLLELDRHRFCCQACATTSLRFHMDYVSQVLPHHAVAASFQWISDEALLGIAIGELAFLLTVCIVQIA